MANYIFTYGTLQEQRIQHALFGRTLKGVKDELKGYLLSSEKAYGQYPIIQPSLNKTDTILGMVYELSEHELLQTDNYEGASYTRKKLRLRSGKMAWVYVKDTNSESKK